MSLEHPDCYKYDVYLNGHLARNVVVADDQEGTILFDSQSIDDYRLICGSVELHQSGLFGMAKGEVEIRLLDTSIRIIPHGTVEQHGS